MRFSFVVVLVLLLAACDDGPKADWPRRPQWSIGPWDVYHDTSLTPAEITYLRDSVDRHIALSESMLARTPRAYAPRWRAQTPAGRGTIRIYGRRVKFLNGPHRTGVLSFTDWGDQSVHSVLGPKATTPELSEAVHELREGPDPYQQDPALGWHLLIPAQARMVDQMVRSRP